MTIRSHMEILKCGAKAWNQWRFENLSIQPDFVDCNLAGVNLTGYRFVRTDFYGANLAGADLSQVYLDGSNLTGANLKGATLEGATFEGTNLTNANLSNANLTGALFFETVFGNTDLSNAIGLENCRYAGRNVIDMFTIQRSKDLPLTFLRGCGVSDKLIEYLPSLLSDPIQLHSVFISYSHEDKEFANHLYEALQTEGVRCWYAPKNIQGGKKIHEQIDDAIHAYDKVLLVLSNHSMISEWVKSEIAFARKRESTEKRRMLFPIRLVRFEEIKRWSCFDADTGKDSAREIREYFIPDFLNWKHLDSFRKGFSRLLADLRSEEIVNNEE